MTPRVLITNQIPREVASPIDGLATLQIGGNEHAPMSRQELLYNLSDVIGIVNQGEVCVDEELLEAAPQLKIIANVAIGIDNFDLDALTERGIWGTNAPNFFAPPVAEYAIAGMIAISRRLLEADAFVRSGQWKSFEPGRWDGFTLRDKTLGIIGFGQIGQALSEMAKGFGMRVLKASKSDGREVLLPLLGESDFVSIHVPQVKETYHLIGREELELMMPHAILVNASRGAIVDQHALTEALERNVIGGAVLDVFEFEPSVPKSLLSMKNVLLSPHIAGGTVESRRSARLCAFQNVAAALRGERPPNAINNVKTESILR